MTLRAVADLRWSGLDIPLPMSGAVSFRLVGAAAVPGTWSAWLQPLATKAADLTESSARFTVTADGGDVVASLAEVGDLPTDSLRVVLAVDGQPVAAGTARRSWRHRSNPPEATIAVGDTNITLDVGNVTIIGGAGGGVSSLQALVDVDIITVPPLDGQALVFADETGQWVPGPGGLNVTAVDWTGHGPPTLVPGSQPGDLYLDLETGDVYRLD